MERIITIEEFGIINPPTGGEVADAAYAAMRDIKLLPLVLQPLREVPPPVPVSVSLKIRQITHLDEGTIISGPAINIEEGTQAGNALTVQIGHDSQLPATASWVVEF